ncbi:POU domain, class 6, transcription factor 1-like isoform X1 [Anguilla rostrata]|uniref:POU domain, class 6, transcription factor 1-like isoform X1 n=1 Tax=Anguilla rostrata TaxID=7938 RepID=UPI0030D2564D
MDQEGLSSGDAPLTVNEQPLDSCPLKFPTRDEQVIVMPGQETIRVLEVEVDASLPALGSIGNPEPQGEDSPRAEPAEGSDQDTNPTNPSSTRIAEAAVEVLAPVVQMVASSAPNSMALSQSQSPVPITVQASPQILTPEALTALISGLVAPPGSVGQPLLIPLSVAGSVGGQGGLAVFTFPTASVAALSGLTAATPPGSVLKLPFGGLQAATLLNTVQPQLHTAAQTVVQPQLHTAAQTVFQPQLHTAAQTILQPQMVQTAAQTVLQPQMVQTAAQTILQPQMVQTAAQTVLQPQVVQTAAQTVLQPQMVQAAVQTVLQPQMVQTAAQTPAASAASAVDRAPEPNSSVATLQTAGLSFNPAIFSVAPLGEQPQFISSLTTTPIFTSTVSGVAGLASQIITNAQGQVIGAFPLLVNPLSLTGGPAAAPTPPAQGLQVQNVTPQLVLNAQGQIISIGNGVATTMASAFPKPTVPAAPAKSHAQGPGVAVTQSAVVIAPQPSAVKTVSCLSSPVSLNLVDSPTVGQLVSKPHHAATEEDGINLEEIREFAKGFKIRRLSLGLTQTQVGQALTATQGPAYSQSAICRFEKLDITPKSAQKLKPVLERWLVEAELWNQKGQQNLMEFVGGEPSKKRKRRTSFTPQAIEALNACFEKNALPTGQEITEIAKELSYDREVVRVWFCNRRQTLKNTSKLNVFTVQ